MLCHHPRNWESTSKQPSPPGAHWTGAAVCGHEILGQFDCPVVEAIQLIHDEFEVRGKLWRCSKTPEKGWDVRKDGQKEQDIWEELTGETQPQGGQSRISGSDEMMDI